MPVYFRSPHARVWQVEVKTFRRSGLGAFALYLLISILLLGLRVVGSPATAHVGFTSDVAMMMWYLVWWPHAIGRGINPFITHAVWPTTGYNLTWATSIPAIAIAFAPVTIIFGPVVAYNLAALMAPALSAWTAFLLCRRLTGKFVGSLLSGYLYGFSPYQLAHCYSGHLSLTFSFIPPLCILLVLSCIEAQKLAGQKGAGRVFRFTLWLALLLVIQCLISNEVLATMTMVGGAALIAAFILMPGKRSELRLLILPIASAYCIAAIILAPFLYYAFVAGSPPREPIFPSSFFSADLLSFFVPGPLMLIPPQGAPAIIAHSATLWEEGCYIGLPLILIAIAYFAAHFREPRGRLLAGMFFLTAGAELGPVLYVNRHGIMRLPWTVVEMLPLVRQALPIRFGNYMFLILSIVVTLWFYQDTTRFKKLAVASIVLAFLPNPALAWYRSIYGTPAFFAQGLYRQYLRPKENVLIIPYGRNGASMAWQAESWMYFRMPGGHLSTTPDDFRRWPVVNTLETSLPLPDSAAQLKAFAAAYKIDAIVVADDARDPERNLATSLGVRPLHIGGVSLYRLPPDILDDPVSLPLLQKTASEAWFSELLCAAQRFVADGMSLAGLNPARAHELGLLPDSKWSENLQLLFAAAPHGASNGLWVGAGRDGAVEIGLFTTAATVADMVSGYRPYIISVLYPYPHRYSRITDSYLHFLMVRLRPSILKERVCK